MATINDVRAKAERLGLRIQTTLEGDGRMRITFFDGNGYNVGEQVGARQALRWLRDRAQVRAELSYTSPQVYPPTVGVPRSLYERLLAHMKLLGAPIGRSHKLPENPKENC